uniref:Uncharacterized protein n=1 Tax=Tetranychus urticae TaxID=32264 RepID=T1K9N7_TETUR
MVWINLFLVKSCNLDLYLEEKIWVLKHLMGTRMLMTNKLNQLLALSSDRVLRKQKTIIGWSNVILWPINVFNVANLGLDVLPQVLLLTLADKNKSE